MAGKPAARERPAPRRRTLGTDSDLSLFSTEGPFEGFPGPVLVAANNGIVLAANSLADPIGKQLKSGGPPELREAISAALRGHPAQINPLFVPLAEGRESAPRAYDVVVLPWGEGAAALLLGRDVTLERSLRAALIESRQRFKDLVEVAGDFAWETDCDGRFIFLSSESVLGYAAAALLNERAEDLLVEAREAAPNPFTSRIKLDTVELWARRADGAAVCLAATVLPLFAAEGQWIGARGLCRDIAAKRQTGRVPAEPEASSSGGGEATPKHAPAMHRANDDDPLARLLRNIRGENSPSRILASAADDLIPALGVAGVVIYRLSQEGEMALEVRSGSPLPDALATALSRTVEQGAGDVDAACATGKLLAMVTGHEGAANGILGVWRSDSAAGWADQERDFLDALAAEVGKANAVLCQTAVTPSGD
jgi:PAS domain S-box-containing protein